ncbi:MAG: TonB family protein [Myxococcales bacterium]|nr:TonB family protein [Myxococcales bacterium]
MSQEERQPLLKRDDPALLTFLVALAGSMLVHGPVYGVLGILADDLLAPAPRAEAPRAEPIELELQLSDPDPTPTTDDAVEVGIVDAQATEVPTEERLPEERPTPQREQPRAEPEREPEPEPAVTPPPPTPPRSVPLPDPELMAIDQRSRDPNVEPPPDTQYVAQDNQRVEEEMIAEERSVHGNQDESALEIPTDDPEASSERESGAEEEVIAERRDAEGADRGHGVERHDAQREAERRGSDRRVASQGDGREESPGQVTRDERAGARGVPAQRAPRYETVVIHDGLGTLVVRRPVGTGGSEASEREGTVGRGAGELGDGGGRRRRRASGRGRGRGADGPDLQLSWNDFESIMGEEQLRADREAVLRERQSRLRGRHAERAQAWADFRAAIENFTSNVRSGHQTALNARAHPFAAYIAELHRRLHDHYHLFVDNIPADPSHPYNQGQLSTRLELAVRPDGTLERVGVVRSSGLSAFDFSAWKAVMNAQPYPPSPENIRSVDGLVYLHYTFYRDQPFCHQANASPYILDAIPPPRRRDQAAPAQGPDGERVVPQGARAWRSEGRVEGAVAGEGSHEGTREAVEEPPSAPPRHREETPSRRSRGSEAPRDEPAEGGDEEGARERGRGSE